MAARDLVGRRAAEKREAEADLVAEERERRGDSVRAADCERKTTVRTLSRLAIARPEPELLTIEVEADAFLKNMVRILVGTLCECGWGKRTPSDVQQVLAGGDRRRAGITAPAQGLALVRVDY